MLDDQPFLIDSTTFLSQYNHMTRTQQQLLWKLSDDDILAFSWLCIYPGQCLCVLVQSVKCIGQKQTLWASCQRLKLKLKQVYEFVMIMKSDVHLWVGVNGQIRGITLFPVPYNTKNMIKIASTFCEISTVSAIHFLVEKSNCR